MLSVAAAILVSCSNSRYPDGWPSDARNSYTRQMCDEALGIDEDSADCRCLLDATMDAFPSAIAFFESGSPLASMTAGYEACGFECGQTSGEANARREGWPDEAREAFEQQACADSLGLDPGSPDCRCLLAAAMDAYPNARDLLSTTTQPSTELVSGYAACGYEL